MQKEFGLRLGETLIKLGKVTKAEIEWVISKQLDIPHIMVEQIELDPVLIGKFPKDLLLDNKILPPNSLKKGPSLKNISVRPSRGTRSYKPFDTL